MKVSEGRNTPQNATCIITTCSNSHNLWLFIHFYSMNVQIQCLANFATIYVYIFNTKKPELLLEITLSIAVSNVNSRPRPLTHTRKTNFTEQ